MMVGGTGAARQAIDERAVSGTKRANNSGRRTKCARVVPARGRALIALRSRASSKRVLPGPKLGEHRDAVRQIAARMVRRGGANACLGRAQKRIGRALLTDSR